MSYLVIMVAVALLGITRLVVMHRRERARLTSIDGFRSSLAAIEAQTDPRPAPPSTSGGRATGPPPTRRLDPARRAAANRRIAARRARRAWAVRDQRVRMERQRRTRRRRPRVAD